MRALLITVVLAVIAGAGYLFYRTNAPAPEQADLFAPPAAPPSAGAGDCLAENARYRLRGDPRLHVRLEPDPETPEAHKVQAGVEMVSTLPLQYVVLITTKAEEHRFAAIAPSDGYQRNLLYPVRNGRAAPPQGEPIQLYLFDADFGYVAGAPHPGDAAPAHIFAPGVTRYIYNLGPDRRIDAPIGFFDFDSCNAPARTGSPTAS